MSASSVGPHQVWPVTQSLTRTLASSRKTPMPSARLVDVPISGAQRVPGGSPSGLSKIGNGSAKLSQRLITAIGKDAEGRRHQRLVVRYRHVFSLLDQPTASHV